ncbi:hypothetical protein A1O1_05923 [Capronia coronata CBS 617.96]|uniref:Uncharacterized protein n=1 Tax=Capronia coronata CBS 617.96 TaxID=1182541 RepID=W9YTF0_9EURO|nr:uncharacterized protein A1O1_05923 [Capronia coronata CBS 617.96]EXJ85559.1 hypothetical protein A1O1_05923 [Capronia coronata CBS 617.96]
MSDSLDEEIAQVRAEIQALTQRRKLLASSLLSTTKVQSRLSRLRDTADSAAPNPNIVALLETATTRSQYNVHRLAFGATSFPFHDPSPELQSKNPLLGIRIDICDRTGRFDSPYYIFCVRTGTGTGTGTGNGNGNRNRNGTGDGRTSDDDLRIHRHTIPALVPLQDYEKRYLPLPDEGYGSAEDSIMTTANNEGDNDGPRTQDLHGLVERVRHDLIAWRLRQEAIDLLREELGLPIPKAKSHDIPNPNEDSKSMKQNIPDDDDDNDDPEDENMDGSDDDGASHDPVGLFGVREFSAVSVDARQIRIIWADGRVARLRITEEGRIEKVVVIGLDGRMRDQERILMDGIPMLRELGERLEEVERHQNALTRRRHS